MAELLGVLGELALDGVGDEGGDNGAAAGITPAKKPMTEPRAMAGPASFHSSLLGQSLPILALTVSVTMTSSSVSRISLRPNIPIAMVTKSKPFIRSRNRR